MIPPTQQSPQPMPRLLCSNCQRPQSTCLCALVQQVANTTEVLILQHPLEQHQAKGSATLLQLCLTQCRIAVAEQFDLDTLLNDSGLHNNSTRQNILLYPPSADTPTTATVSPAQLLPQQTRLIILDGTWRKTRKLLHLNPQLAALPRLQLDNLPASRYHIRKAHNDGQLSTLEACCLALGRIEREMEHYQPVLDAFEQFNGRLAQFSPHK